MTENEKPPIPFTPGDAAFMLPPPSYDQVMGVYQTSVKTVQDQHSDMPPLSYIDIMPRCLKRGNIKGKVIPTFDNFSGIMEGANRWLRDNAGLQVWKCETVIRRLNALPDGSISYDLNDMLRSDPTFGFVVYIRGLRLWLTKNTNPSSTPQQLGLRNEVPAKRSILVPYHNRMFMSFYSGFAGFGSNAIMQNGLAYHQFSTFENLYKTIDAINEKLTADPLPGTILTVETDFIKAYEYFKNQLDPDTACWYEDKNKFRRETQVIRIFYILGQSARETIGLKDFVPEVTAKGDLVKQATFENLHDLLSSVTEWIPTNQGIRIVNIQRNDVTVDRLFGGDVGISPEDTDETILMSGTRRMVQSYRLFYVKSQAGAPPAPARITTKLFTPVRTGALKFETMTQTMDRIDAWLKLTGVPILSVCTMEALFNQHKPDGMETTKTDYIIPGTASKKWLTAIRVFFPTVFQEPDPSLLPPIPNNKGSSSCTIL